MKRERILIVEDEIDLLNVIDFNFTRRGYISAGSLDGIDAMKKLQSFKPGLIILDLMLPEMDGWKICRHIRQQKLNCQILMLTAKAMPEDRLKGFEIGADDYLTKPFHMEELMMRAEKLLVKRRERGAFNRYVSPHVVNEIVENPEKIHLAGERREITVLFADVRGFTALTRQMHPEEIVEILNGYFNILTEIIFYFDGMVDKFIGDAVMGVFGSPIPKENHLQQGIKTAIVINKVMIEVNRYREKKGLIQLPMGLGLDSGHVVVGSMGSKVRMEYTAIGDAVNVASRLSGIAKGGEILIGEKVYLKIKEDAACMRMPDVNIKGIEKPFTIYNVLDIKDVWKPVIDDAIHSFRDKMGREDIAFA